MEVEDFTRVKEFPWNLKLSSGIPILVRFVDSALLGGRKRSMYYGLKSRR